MSDREQETLLREMQSRYNKKLREQKSRWSSTGMSS